MHNRLLKNKRILLTIPLLLASSLLLPLHVAPSAHAQLTGLVCITTSTTATSCGTSAPTISGLSVGQTFSVGVFVQGSDPMGGFDIFVKSDPSLVAPVSAALGSLIVSPAVTNICINGSAQAGTCTPNSANGAGVVEANTLESSGTNECSNVGPCSGMAFTITYKVISAFGTTSLSYPTNPSCSLSSVSSPANVCVLVSDAFGSPLSENTQGANLSAGLTGAFVCITSTAADTSCPVGPPNIGPVTLGPSFTVGVFIQNSAPLGGFDIHVATDPNFLLPTDAALGSLITTPALTTICTNGQVIVGGPCTTPSGSGVAEVSTIESSGSNDPGTGLAFTITYTVVGVTPNTAVNYPTDPSCAPSSVPSPPNLPNTCVVVLDNVGNALTENIQPANVIQVHDVDNTGFMSSQTGNTDNMITCDSPTPVGGMSATPIAHCTVIVNDTATTGRIFPIGEVKFQTGGFGVLYGNGPTTNSCILQQIPHTPMSRCAVLYLPISVGSGIHNIFAIFPGPPPGGIDAIHRGNVSASFPMVVTKATPIVSPFCVVDQSGGSCPAAGIPAGHGYTVHANVVMNGGWPLTGVSGSVTYAFFANGACSGTSSATFTVQVGDNDNVPNSGSFAPTTAGSYSVSATYSGDGNDVLVSSCISFLVNNFDFNLAWPAGQVNVGPGLFNDTTLTVTGLNGFMGDVFFSPIGLPAGVTVMFVPNPATVATAGGSASTTMRIFATAKVAHSFTFQVKGTWEGLINKLVTISVTVVGAPPTILKVNWNHELSLSLDGPQVWHVFINNTETVPINVVFRITAKSLTNPGNTFDIVCGTTCVNTDRHGVNSTPGLTPILVPALTVPHQIKISYTLASKFVNQNVKFTITIWITTATGTFYQPTNSFSGTFFVFP